MFRFISPAVTAIALLFAVAASAQTAGPAVTELSLERVVALPTALSSTELALPPGKAQGITSGALEIRERIIYNPAGASLTSTVFAVQSGSPLPTPLNANLTDALLGVYVLSVDRIYSTTVPRNSLLFTGTVASSSPGGVLGNVAGAPFSVSLGYSNESPAKVVDLVHLIASRVAVYSKSAIGTLTVPKPVTPPAPGAGPQIVIVAPSNTISKQINLDASATTDVSGTSLSFAWKSLNKSSVMLNPNTAVATVQFGEGLGEYSFELTVTNGNGASAKQTVTVSYFGR